MHKQSEPKLNETYEIPTEIIMNNMDKKKIFPIASPSRIKQLRITDVALFSTTPPQQADFTMEIIKQYYDDKTLNKMTITDTSACIGGNIYSWLDYFREINFVEISNLHVEIFKHNMGILFPDSPKKNIKIYNENYLNIYKNLSQDILFMDPPWGGVDYNRVKNIDLYYFRPTDGNKPEKIAISDLINKELYKMTKMIVLKVPFNYNFNVFNNSPFKYKERISLLKNNGILYEILVLAHDPIQFPNEKLKTIRFPTLGYRCMKYSYLK